MKHEIPDDWHLSDKLMAWALANGFGPAEYVEKHAEWFRDYCEAKGAKYANFDAAFRNCLRGDWGEVRKKFVPSTSRFVKREEVRLTQEDRAAADRVLAMYRRRA